MKIVNEDGKPTIKSEGKILEFIPIIEDNNGQPYALPPVQYHVDNELLGFKEYHALSYPTTYYNQNRVYINGSNGSSPVGLTMLIRVLEDGTEGPEVRGSVDVETVREIVNAIKESWKSDIKTAHDGTR